MENRVAQRRMELGLSQEELARFSNVSRQTISDIEQGTHIPRLDTALMICAALGQPVQELFSMLPFDEQ